MVTTGRTLSVPGYKVVRLLGNGARSTIWQVRHLSTGKFYALKRVVKRESADSRFVEQVATVSANCPPPWITSELIVVLNGSSIW